MLFALRISPLVLWIDSQAESFVIEHELMVVAVFYRQDQLSQEITETAGALGWRPHRSATACGAPAVNCSVHHNITP